MPRLHHVQLAMPAGQEERARGFHVGVLGMREVPRPPVLAARGGAWFRDGELELHLGVEEPFAPARRAHPGILVEDLDAAVARLAAAGIAARPDGELPGHRRVYVDDPFGNRVELLQPVRTGTGRREGIVATLRARVGNDPLLLPGVDVCLFDDAGRLLLARHRTDGRWATPGGAVEMDESLPRAVVREAAEELGVEVRPVGVVAVAGPHRVRYPNGDVTAYVTTMVAVELVAGTPQPDHDEIDELRWCTQDEASDVDLAPWLAPLLPAVFAWHADGVTRLPDGSAAG